MLRNHTKPSIACKETLKTMLKLRTGYRRGRHVYGGLALISLMLGLAVTPAAAAPSLAVQISNDAHEIQAVNVDATAGQFRLNFGAGGSGVSETADITVPASASDVEAALNSLSNISAGGGAVTVQFEEHIPGFRVYVVAFDRGPLAHMDVDEMAVADGTSPLSGGSAAASVLTYRSAGVNRSDERVDYTVNVTNAGPTSANVGDKLTCDARSGSWFEGPTFSFQWVSNGATATGPTAQPTPTTGTYVVQASDQGHSLQCVVVGNNVAGSAASFSLPISVEPAPSPAPPMYSGSGNPRSSVTGGNKALRTCTPPTSWTGSPIWTFQWLRNGVVIPGATGNTYLPKAAVGEEDELKVIQCMVTGKTGSGEMPTGGTVIAMSNASLVGTNAEFNAKFGKLPPNNNSPNATTLPFIIPASATSGLVTLELELPAGEETIPFRVIDPNDPEKNSPPPGWNCVKVTAVGSQHAKVVCSRSDTLLPGASYPAIEVFTALGADAPGTATATATVFGGGASGTGVDEDVFVFKPALPFGLSVFRAEALDPEGNDYTQAGGHPFVGVGTFAFKTKRILTGELPGDNLNGEKRSEYAPIEHVKQTITDLPRGFVGNALAVPELCPTVQDVAANTCPPGSLVGKIDTIFNGTGAIPKPLYALEPEAGTPAQFAFEAASALFTLSARLRPEDGYAVSLELAPAPVLDLLEAKATVCAFGAKGGVDFKGCKEAGEAGANPKPLFANPTRCGSPPPVARAHLDSWENPGAHDSEGIPDYSDSDWKMFESANPEVTGCELVQFEPEIELTPGSKEADSPAGLDIELTMPTEGLEKAEGCHEKQGDESSPLAPECISQANMKKAKIIFPEGMAINASAGHGLGACSAEQVKLETNKPISCPDSSKIGSVEIETPILERTLTGDVYIAKQGDVGGALIGLYLVFESKRDGIIVKVPGRVDPNPVTGQLVATVDDSPEAPFSTVRMHFPGGPRATLLTPPTCGTKEIKAELTPWSGGAPVVQTSTFDVSSGPGGGPCPTNALDPKLSAGTIDATAGKTSPFLLRLSRDDGTQRFSALNVHTPPGLSAYLKGIPYCPQSTIDAISRATGTGQAEISSPSCPAASQIGTAIAGAGGGPTPLFVETGKAYLAGPYKGAPLSIVLVAPAVAGPLDLGNVVVQTAIRINPETAEITAVSDPVPTILHGILLDVRDIRVALDRPRFTLNPTNCEPMSVGVDVKGENGGSATVSNRFQAKDCGKLKFGPDLSLRLIGGTKRGDNPKLRTVLTTGADEANIGRAAVTIPRSEFLDQSHIRTVCTRVQFRADACPKGSVYGHAKAFTPLLDYAVAGPVYLRSSDNKLPDLVFALRGPDYQPIEAVVVARIDSIKGQIRATIEGAPDVPVSKFVLTQQGGKKGLLINSRDICARKNRATVKLTGQNGKTHNFRPVVKNSKCNKSRRGKGKRRSR